VTVTRGAGDLAAGELRVALPPLALPADLTPGVYYLNGLIAHGAAVALLRRALVVEPPRNPSPEDSP
jgi:hypothetical protein